MRDIQEEDIVIDAFQSQRLLIEREIVDDIPLLYGQMKKMDLKHLIDHHFPVHGNHQGLSPGQLVELWLCYILSHGDHRLCHVQTWAERIPHTLNMLPRRSRPTPSGFQR